MQTILTHKIASITEMHNPEKVIKQAGKSPVAILDNNTVIGYLVPNSVVATPNVQDNNDNTSSESFK